MAVLSSVSPGPASAAPPMRPKARSAALGAGTKSGSTQPARATPSQASSRAATLSNCTARTRSVSFTGSPRTAGPQPREIRRAALLGPSLGAVLDDAGERVGADDQDERHHHEGDVVGRAEQAVRMNDQRAHARTAAQEVADD